MNTNERQLAFEEKSHREAVVKLKNDIQRAKEKGYFSSTLPARQTIQYAALELSQDLLELIAKTEASRAVATVNAGMCPELKRWFLLISPEEVAVILLKSIFDIHGGFENTKTGPVANKIGRRLEDEIRFRFYELTAPEEVVKAAWKRVTEANSTPHYRRISTKLITEKRLIELEPEAELWSPWSCGYATSMGLLLLDLAIYKGWVTKNDVRKGKKTTGNIKLSQAALAFFEDKFDEMFEIAFFLKPLIEKPLPWVYEPGPAIKNTSGGYHTEKMRLQQKLCRGYGHKSEFGELSIKFLNVLQETAYAVDTEIVKVGQHLRQKQLGVGSFLAYERFAELDLRMPEHLVALPKDDPDRVQWRRDKAMLFERHNDLRKKAVRSLKSLLTAEEFLKYPRFYLSWSNDYRGRVYPQQPWLSPQSTEFEKSLIRFAEGCKLDARGLWSVRQALGAAYLGTRLNLEDRVSWTKENEDLIRRVGSSPLETMTEWEQAKEPFQFLQLCVEYYKVVLTKQQHLWYVPVGVDATCSGLQLLSSALRDEKGMKHSNVLTPEDPSAPPEDAYIHVLERAKQLALEDPETAHLAEFLIHRNLGKTTMVMLYGAKLFTVTDRVIDVFVSRGEYGQDKQVSMADCQQMAKLLVKASGQIFPRAFAGLAWMRKLATKASDITDEFTWNTPAGDTIRYQYFQADSVDVRLPHLGKVRIPLNTLQETDLKAMQSALAPSFVHSLDAALLKVSFSEWNRPLTAIHDCIKVLPADLDRSLEAIRRAFYAVCDGNPLADLADTLKVPEERFERLKQGDGNLASVFGSTYLFN